MKNYKFSYDKEFDDLLIFDSNSKSKGSVELGDIILDFNSKKEFVGIQLMNASKILKDISGEVDVNIILEHLKECRVETITKNNLLIIKIFLISDKRQISSVLSVPNITESSPALAYA